MSGLPDPRPIRAETSWGAIALTSAALFIVLALSLRVSGVLPLEKALYAAIHGWASAEIVSLFGWINYLGDRRVLLPATLLLLWIAPGEARRWWWLWAGVMVLAPIVEGFGKELIGRPRPTGSAFGFPSGHVTAASTYFLLLAYLIARRWNAARRRTSLVWIAAGIPVLLVGIARIVLQAHWPGDAIGGVLLGTALVAAAVSWFERTRSAGPRTPVPGPRNFTS